MMITGHRLGNQVGYLTGISRRNFTLRDSSLCTSITQKIMLLYAFPKGNLHRFPLRSSKGKPTCEKSKLFRLNNIPASLDLSLVLNSTDSMSLFYILL